MGRTDTYSLNLLIAAVAILGITMILEQCDAQDAAATDAHYCEMVALWNATKHLPVKDRLGWPPYKGECWEEEGGVNDASF